MDIKTIEYSYYRLYGLKFLTAFFLIVVYTNIILTFAGIEIFQDFHENRKLADLPAFRLKNISYNSFVSVISELESYINDHFTFRKPLIMAYNSLKYYLFNTSSNPLAIPGKDDWVFYGMKRMQDDYERKSQLPVEYLNKLESSIFNRYIWLAKNGIPFLFIVAPNKHNIHYQFLPDHWQRGNGPSFGEMLIKTIDKKTGIGVNIFPELRKASEDRQVYYRIDTHWNHDGGLIAVEALLLKIGAIYPDLPYRKLPEMKYQSDIFSPGNFGRVMGVPLKEVEKVPMPGSGWSSKNISTSELKALLPEKATIKKLANLSAPETIILILGDSYIEGFDRYLAEAFRKTIFVNLWHTEQTPINRFPTEFIEHLQPDLVIFMMSERRIGDHPTNGYFYDGQDPTDIIRCSNPQRPVSRQKLGSIKMYQPNL